MQAGELLRVDLGTGKIGRIPIVHEVLQDYLGGRGLNMRLLFPSLSRPGDPFDPATPLVMSPGLMCGFPSLGSRMNISARSPESGYLGDSNIGGELGAELKASGTDSLFIVGQSNTPVYLWVHDHEVEIRDATGLWGKDTVQTQKEIRKELRDERVQIGCICLAGENKVRFAGIRTGLKSSAGRTGMGAVMGAKRLKAVAVRGTGNISLKLIHQIARREGFGNVLAEGVLASEMLGTEASKFLLRIKNLPIEMTDERAPKSFALGMATATRGACHMRSRPSLDVIGLPESLLKNLYGGEVSSSYLDYRGKGRMVWWHERLNALCDALGICRFLSVFSSPHAPQAKQFSELLFSAFGEKFSAEDLWEAGERICTLERMILIRNGLGKDDDTLPSRYFDEPIQGGPAEGEVIDRSRFNEILEEYYYLHGWDNLGVLGCQHYNDWGLRKSHHPLQGRMKIRVNSKKCSGCHLCEMACSIYHLGLVNINRSAIHIRKDDLETGACQAIVCRQCEKMPCIGENDQNRAEYRARFIWERALSDACPFMALFHWRDEVYHCDLCGGEPRCVMLCSTGALEVNYD
jgi:aldehyde:ferredoxin oxidoreductase